MLSSIAFTTADIILESNADYTISTNKVKVRSGKLRGGGVQKEVFHKIIAKYMKILYPQIFFIWNSLFGQKILSYLPFFQIAHNKNLKDVLQ